AGQCGKLKCCLNYELDSYLDTLKDFPDTNTALETQQGRAFHRKTDIFKRMMLFAYGRQEGDQSESEAGYGGNWIAISVDRVNDIIEMNKGGQKPHDLKEHEDVVVEAAPD